MAALGLRGGLGGDPEDQGTVLGVRSWCYTGCIKNMSHWDLCLKSDLEDQVTVSGASE